MVIDASLDRVRKESPLSVMPAQGHPQASVEPDWSIGITSHCRQFSATRKRGKCMSRRAGQNPSVRIRLNRTKGVEEYFFQYWIDVPGQEERRRETEVIGPIKTMTKSEAERKKLEFILNLRINSNEYKIPSSLTFAHAVKHYREIFAPRMLRQSTFSVADGHLKVHLEPDWNEIPVQHIDIDAVNEWIWKKTSGGFVLGDD
jgi:hypothetical protein